MPKKTELIEEIKSQDLKQQFIYEQMARFLESLPPQVQMTIQQLKPDEQEAQLMELMMLPPDQQAMQIQQMAGIPPSPPQMEVVA